jgi:hypothetical protein
MEISEKEFFERAEKLYGANRMDWKFVCTGCHKIQSGRTIVEQMKNNQPSQRHGLLKKGDGIYATCECYQPDCNWVAYGLFNSNILLIHDPTKPHNENLKENCSYHFPLADDAEMLAAAGVKDVTVKD